jgi:hypothetical protein
MVRLHTWQGQAQVCHARRARLDLGTSVAISTHTASAEVSKFRVCVAHGVFEATLLCVPPPYSAHLAGRFTKLFTDQAGWLSDELLSLRPRVASEVTRASCLGPWNCPWTRCRSWTKQCHPLYAASCAAPQTRTRLCWRTQCSCMALSLRRRCHWASLSELFLRCRARSQLEGCAPQ